MRQDGADALGALVHRHHERARLGLVVAENRFGRHRRAAGLHELRSVAPHAGYRSRAYFNESPRYAGRPLTRNVSAVGVLRKRSPSRFSKPASAQVSRTIRNGSVAAPQRDATSGGGQRIAANVRKHVKVGGGKEDGRRAVREGELHDEAGIRARSTKIPCARSVSLSQRSPPC